MGGAISSLAFPAPTLPASFYEDELLQVRHAQARPCLVVSPSLCIVLPS